MQEKDNNLGQPIGVCGRLYSLVIGIFTSRHQANCYSSDSCSSHTEDSESEDEFWEAEDSTASDESNETSQDLALSARQAGLHKGKEKMSQIEVENKGELHMVQELGMYYGTPLSLVQEKTNYTVSAKNHSQEWKQRARAREAVRPELMGSPDMMKRRHSMKAKMPKQRSEEVAVKTGKTRMLSRVFTNINERSDAFIRSRREAMRKNYSVGSKLF